MENHFSRLGQLVFDLTSGVQFELTDESNFTFLAEEFRRISIALGSVWAKKEMGWTYDLEFHFFEGERLLQKIRIDRTYQELIVAYGQVNEILRRAYKMLLHFLNEIVIRINIMRYENEADLGGFSLN